MELGGMGANRNREGLYILMMFVNNKHESDTT
jgi:hypothetical protein